MLLATLIMAIVLSVVSKPNGPVTGPTNVPSETPTPTTLFPNQPTSSPSAESQGAIDKNFGNELNKAINSYPWYKNLPLTNTNYFVLFDTSQKKIIARIYSKSNNLSTQQVEDIKNSILSKLSQLGIPTSQYPVVWQTDL